MEIDLKIIFNSLSSHVCLPRGRGRGRGGQRFIAARARRLIKARPPG